jgi:hypothetical protein
MDSSKQAQRAVIQFLSTEGVSWTDIHSRMKNVYGTECIHCMGLSVYTQSFLQHRSGQKQVTVPESPFTKPARTAWTLLRMDPRGPKHCRGHWFVNKLGYTRVLFICWTAHTLQDDKRSIKHQTISEDDKGLIIIDARVSCLQAFLWDWYVHVTGQLNLQV